MYKRNTPTLDIGLNGTPICEWNVIRCGFRNAYQKVVYLREIKLHVQINLA